MIFEAFLKRNFESIIRLQIKSIGLRIVHSLFLLCISFASTVSLAEGTKELMATTSDFGFIQINDLSRKFATYNAPIFNRLYIHICNAGEIIYLGFKQSNNDVSFQLKDPNGNIVITTQALPTVGSGYIASYNQALVGPQQLFGPLGYNALNYTSLIAGDYYIEFTNPGNTHRIFDLFDITVASGSTAKMGRLWSYMWDITTNAAANPFTSKMYIYSKDSIVTAIDFNGMQPFGAVIAANSTGLSNTGNLIADRASQIGDYALSEYKIFLNDPDSSCYPTGSFGNFTAPTKVIGCDPANRCININVNKPGQIELLLDLNGTSGYQPNTTDLLIITKVIAGVNCIPWNSKDGQGNTITNINGIPLQVNYLNGVTHLPLYDVEHNTQGYIVELIRPAGPKPQLYWNDTNITAGTALDAKVNLTGCSYTLGCHKWKNRGNNAASETINTWWYPSIVTDNLTFNLSSVMVDADTRNPAGQLNDSLVCEQISTFQLQGSISGASGGTWTGGLGSFTPSRNITNPNYTPTTNERNTGFVKLYLTSTIGGGCSNSTDSILIRFEKAPIINIGADKIVCSKNNMLSVTAILTNATSGIWSGGAGNFTNATNPITNYTPVYTEISAGIVHLIFTSTGRRLCKQTDDTILITFHKPVEISVGPTIEICSGIKTISIAASSDNTPTLLWTGGSGTFQPTNTLITQYTLADKELNSTEIDLILTGSNGICPDSSSVLKIKIIPLPIVHAGTDTLICGGTDITLVGTSNATTNEWYKLPSQTILSNQKTVVLQQLASNSSYVFESKNANACRNSDTVFVKIYELPTLNPGGPYCMEAGLMLHAHATNIPPVSGSYIWSQGNSTLQSDPVNQELSINEAGVYTLTYKTNGCSKDVNVIVNPKPILTSPDTLSVCNASSLTLYTKPITGAIFTWFDSNNAFIQNGVNANIISTGLSNTYFVKAEDVNGCSNIDSIITVSTPIPIFSIKNAEICMDSIATFEVIPTNIPTNLLSQLSYEWNYNSAVVSNANTFQTNKVGTYYVNVSLHNCSGNQAATLTAHDLPTSSLDPQYAFCSDNGNTRTLNAGNGYKYLWVQSNETSQSISVDKPGMYDVIIYNTFLCRKKFTTILLEECKPTLFVSSAFSPNGDHINDIYQTFDNHIGSYSMTIFSRWGEIIFQSTDKNVFWDGYYKGQLMPVGVYPYVIKYEGDTDTYKGPYSIEGSVTLIK
jgi:gliding motility-associated-like protein